LKMKIKNFAMITSIIAVILNLSALYMVFFYAPVEIQMGAAQKIFYYHVPSAISSYIMLFVSFVFSIVFLVTKKEFADIWAYAGAEVGLVFILCVLISGPIWGRSAWGKWWVWEPRLTTFLILFLMYFSYILLRAFSSEEMKAKRISAILSIIAFLDVPIVNRAIALWGSVVHPRKVSLEKEMWQTFVVSFFAVAFLAFSFLLWRVHIGSYKESENG
jgi:heme exporter protein C